MISPHLHHFEYEPVQYRTLPLTGEAVNLLLKHLFLERADVSVKKATS
jgi:hypothetical protein